MLTQFHDVTTAIYMTGMWPNRLVMTEERAGGTSSGNVQTGV